MTLREAHLRTFLPRLADPARWALALAPALARFEISSPARIAAFLAQTAHESAGFTRLEESLSYSARRICAVWPRRFHSVADAEPYAHAPERLANRVYGSRLGNGPEASGDGWRFRGRGLIQLTGRGNYRRAGMALALPLEIAPDLVADDWEVAALVAGHFWHVAGCNELADDHSDDDDRADFVRICQLVNGGTHGLAERTALWERAKAALAMG